MVKKYRHYLQRTDKAEAAIDLERDFKGVQYLSLSKNDEIGATENIIVEKYADSNRLRVFLPDDDSYVNDFVELTLTIIITGNAKEREVIKNSFLDYIRKGVHKYWNTATNVEIEFIVKNKITQGEEMSIGSNPYVEIKIPLQTINSRNKLKTI